MPVKPPTPIRTIALDADKLGAIGGGVVALFVAAIQMFYWKADPMTTVIRSGWVFVGTYAAVFFLVRSILRTTLFEMLAEKSAKREAKREQKREARDTATAQRNMTGEMPGPGDSAAAKP